MRAVVYGDTFFFSHYVTTIDYANSSQNIDLSDNKLVLFIM